MPERPPLSPEELALSYSKFYFLDPDPINPLALQCIREPLKREDVLDPADIAELFQEGYGSKPVCGYYIGDGWSYSAILMQIPNVTIEMIDWWFTWFRLPPKSVPRKYGNLRYKIWDPYDHFDHYPADEEAYKQLTDSSIPYMWRTNGVTDYGVEMIEKTDPPTYKTIKMCPRDPRILDLPDECWDYIYGKGNLRLLASDHSAGIDFFRRTDYGVEVINRVWRGYVVNDEGRIVKLEGFPTPTEEHVVADLKHNLTEKPHFAKFLPQLYAEEGHKPVDAY